MLKTLIKKQFLELSCFFFQNKKTGKNRSVLGTIGFIILMLYVMGTIAVMMLGISAMLGDAMLGYGLDWLYFAFMGLMTVAVGVVGSVFNTYSSLYLSKDNEMLLAMPIPPMKILISRMISILAMSVVFCAIVWAPAVFNYWMTLENSGNYPAPILMFLFLVILVSFLTCLLGWLVAVIAQKSKGKSFLIVFMSLVFIVGYYYLYFNLMNMLSELALHLEKIEGIFHSWLYPMFLLGQGASGDWLSLLIFGAAVVLLFAICAYVLSKNYVKILTATDHTKKAVYIEKTAKVENLDKALLKRDLKRLIASPTYMLNCGLGVFIMLIASVAVVFKTDSVRESLTTIESLFPGGKALLPAMIIAALCMIISMNGFTAPSISLEGKTLWILQSLPVDPYRVLKSKERMHILLNLAGALPLALVLCLIFSKELGSQEIILILLVPAMYTRFTAQFGLFLNLRHPNLNWTNEAAPVKQSLPVFIMIFGGWAAAFMIGLGAYLLFGKVNTNLYLLGVLILLEALTLLLDHWLKNSGTRILMNL